MLIGSSRSSTSTLDITGITSHFVFRMIEQQSAMKLEGGINCYGIKRAHNIPLLNFSCKDPMELHEKNTFLKYVYFLLLPATFDPRSNFYMAYESARVFCIGITTFIVPFQVNFLLNAKIYVHITSFESWMPTVYSSVFSKCSWRKMEIMS